MAKTSAGLIVYHFINNRLEIFLVHPGGPYWAKKDDGAWSIPKGEYEENEDPFSVAKREFFEETGFEIEKIIQQSDFKELPPIKQPSGKNISAWAVEGKFDASLVKSNLFTMEWPPRSGKQAEFPEVDRGDWFSIREAQIKILKGQAGFIDQLCKVLNYDYSLEPLQEEKKDEKSKSQKVQLSLF